MPHSTMLCPSKGTQEEGRKHMRLLHYSQIVSKSAGQTIRKPACFPSSRKTIKGACYINTRFVIPSCLLQSENVAFLGVNVLHLMCCLRILPNCFIQKLNLFKNSFRAQTTQRGSSSLTCCLKLEKWAKPEAFCWELFCVSSFVLLTSPQLVQLKTLFHHMLSRSSSAAESPAKNLSARFPVRMSCFTPTPAPI